MRRRVRTGRVVRARRSSMGGPEWVGGRAALPAYVTEREPYRPLVDLWMELPSGLVVGQRLLDPRAALPSFAETLLEALRTRPAGSPRPGRLRVADDDLAAELRVAIGDATEVVVAPTPELDEVLGLFAESLRDGDDAPSYLEAGRVRPIVVGRLFQAAERLYRAAPWKVANDGQVVRLDVPGLGVEGACVSIIGALGESLGILIFPSLAGYDAMARIAAEELERGARAGRPLDLGSDILSLTFGRGADLPPEMRREVRTHRWPVAGPAAYPLVAHRERDGIPRPLAEDDVRLATACAAALASFVPHNRAAFTEPYVRPVSESYTDDLDLTVRLTTPYHAWPLFERGDQIAPRSALAGRNDPCPCGSGRKYKRCHLAADLARSAPAGAPAPVHELDRRLAEELLRYARRRFGEEWLRGGRDLVDAGEDAALLAPWSIYHLRVRERTLAEWFLDEQGKRLAAAERAWIRAQAGAWLSVWEVRAVDPGRGLELEDLLTGERRSVREASASAMLVARDAVLGRVVDHGGLAVLSGVHSRALPPAEAAEVVRRVRSRLRLRRAVPPERLRSEELGRYLIDRWEEEVLAMDRRRRIPPTLRNTDGDELLFVTDRFEFYPARRAEVEAGLASLEGVSPPEAGDEDPSYTFLREGKESIVLGSAWVSDGALRLETNSAQRADALRRRLSDTFGDLLRHCLRDQTDAGEMVRRAAEGGEPPPDSSAPAEAGPILREWKQRHYAGWPDEPLPALDGQTAREAVRTARGRERVDVLLRELENHEAREPAEARFDVSAIRTALGLD